jgi:peptidoglycan hydrolase-like protein with peptidoglycan-binding domain
MSLIYWEDSANTTGLEPGYYGYGGYWNGPYANLSGIKHKFPGKPVMGYAVRQAGMQGSDAIDAEPGTIGQTFDQCAPTVLAFVKAWTGGSGLFNLPLVYFFASWQTAMEHYLTAHGMPRSRYYINSSHATGTAHFCGPHTCGFGVTQADMTQYKFGGTYDRSVMQSYMLKGNTPLVTPPVNKPGATVKLGDSGTAVARVQERLFNLLYFTDKRSCDGQFGPATETAVKAFQKAAKLTPDGVVGLNTWAALTRDIYNPAAKPPPKPTPRPPLPQPVLRPGDASARVHDLQWYLRNSGLKGVRGIDMDAVYGAQTETAVRNLQGYLKLATDGVYGKDTRAGLSKIRID